MGHAAKNVDSLCDIIDELEAATTLHRKIRVHFEDGSSNTGYPSDVFTTKHQDFLQLEGHLPVPVSTIIRVERAR